MGYQQRFTEKLSGVIDLLYETSDYSQISEFDRDEERWYIKPALRYLFRDWMMLELAYSWDNRDSTDDIFDYTSNTVMFNISFGL